MNSPGLLFLFAFAASALEAALPIVVQKHDGAASGQAGVALFRELPNLASGDKLTFTGSFDGERIRLLDPPWVMVLSDRQLHWRIYFSVDTGEGFKRAVSKYLAPAQMVVLEKLPVVQKYIAAKETGRRTQALELSLYTVYSGKMPKEFAKLDARKTKVSLHCDNLGRANATMQQCFTMRPGRKPAEGIAQFTGTLRLNRPDLNYHQREKQKLHHFNFKLTDAKPIHLKLTEAEMRKRFATEIAKAKNALQQLCAQRNLKFQFDPKAATRVTWVDGQMAVSALITPRPRYSRQPVPYATVSICFDPATGQLKRTIFVQRVHQDPRD